MIVSTIISLVLVCEMAASRFVGIPNNVTPGNWVLWYNPRQHDDRTQFVPHPREYVPLLRVNPGFLNYQVPHVANRHVPRVQQTIVLANSVHILNPSEFNNAGSGIEPMRLENNMDFGSNRHLAHINTQQESNAIIQNRNSNQSSNTNNRLFSGVDQTLTPDNVAWKTAALSQGNNIPIHISFHGETNSLPSNISDMHQASVDARIFPGRILIKSRGIVNISHPRGKIEISRSHNGRSNIIIKTNTKDTAPQMKLSTQLRNITQTTPISDVRSMATAQHQSTTEEVEHEAP
ncbi:hypothetical protein ACJMK2_025425 [Sinanodonta woodiana]|uniref:Uncharacterized protein n=1 Tax=Sinanodonta woodiana TaxID=1069815 RepID=A0ABD3XGF3_SINWO